MRRVELAAVSVACLLALGAGCRRREAEPDGGSAAAEQPAASFRVEPGEPEGEAVEYTVRFPEPHTHHAEVGVIVPTGGADHVELFVAETPSRFWSPGEDACAAST